MVNLRPPIIITRFPFLLPFYLLTIVAPSAPLLHLLPHVYHEYPGVQETSIPPHPILAFQTNTSDCYTPSHIQ